jgi:hypothetical protein
MWLRTVALALIASLAALTPTTPSVASDPNSISRTVTLVIDFSAQSGLATKVISLNELPEKTTGWRLFSLAKLKVQGTQQFPNGFVCRIAGWPKVKQQDCADNPSFKEGHWAYYVTNFQLGPGWLLSGQGAASHIPDCGGYEGWSWTPGGQANKPPRFKVSVRACK